MCKNRDIYRFLGPSWVLNTLAPHNMSTAMGCATHDRLEGGKAQQHMEFIATCWTIPVHWSNADVSGRFIGQHAPTRKTKHIFTMFLLIPHLPDSTRT